MSSSSPSLDFLSQIQNPVNVVLLVVLSYLLLPHLSPLTSSKTRSTPTSHLESYSWLPASHPESIVWKEYTPRTLRRYDGTNTQEGPENRILFAIKGKVYDVTSGRNFYGPDGPYGNFAGRDASRGLAKQSFDLDMLVPIDGPIDTLEDLTPMEVTALREWEMHFQAKYFQCGDFVENH